MEMRYDKGHKKIVRKINKIFQYAREIPALIQLTKLKTNSLRIVRYYDSAYASSHNLTSQLGRIVLAVDDSGTAAPISYKSYKSRGGC